MKIVDLERIPQAAENFKKLRQDDYCWKNLKIDFVELFFLRKRLRDDEVLKILSAKGEFLYFD